MRIGLSILVQLSGRVKQKLHPLAFIYLCAPPEVILTERGLEGCRRVSHNGFLKPSATLYNLFKSSGKLAAN